MTDSYDGRLRFEGLANQPKHTVKLKLFYICIISENSEFFRLIVKIVFSTNLFDFAD